MTAQEARKLCIGWKVVAAFSNSHRVCEIAEIKWPHFLVRTYLQSGEVRRQWTRYRSLYSIDHYRRTYGEPKGG